MRLWVILSVAALSLAAVPCRAQEGDSHEKAVAAIRKRGGKVEADADRAPGSVAVILAGSPDAAESMPHLKGVNNLCRLDL